FQFWGPGAGIKSTKWIVDATNYVMVNQTPTLLLTYLPHLDYDFQRYGPDDPRSRKALAELDAQAGRLIGYGRAQGFEVVVVSEYGIQPVSGAVFLNRFLREADLLEVRETPFGEILDPIASKAFAVVDHQAAHVYVRDPADLGRVRGVLSELPGVERVLDGEGQEKMGIRHPRSGELVLVAEEGRWFAYPWWLEDDMAPDFAATVDIHRKPGYDPGELFWGTGKFHAAWKLFLRKIGFRVLLDVVPLDPSMVGGSHGRLPGKSWEGPVLICSNSEPAVDGIHARDFRKWLLEFMAS
ncbi:MAG TPA: alkaline phosphatase family protein, partial [Planctomycetes bacterium]|nr:alkaline phosphatase family protein [Planctomycetota bacterium]